MNRRSSCFFIRVPGAAATCGQSGCEHVPAALGVQAALPLLLSLLPRRRSDPDWAAGRSAALFIDARAPPPPRTSQWERPLCSPSANGGAAPRNPASPCQQQLVRVSRDSSPPPSPPPPVMAPPGGALRAGAVGSGLWGRGRGLWGQGAE